MKVKIENRSDQRVLLRFMSGATRTLAPHETVKDIENVEVKGNARLGHLQDLGLIAVVAPETKAAKPPAKKRRARSGSTRSSRGRGSARSSASPRPAATAAAAKTAKPAGSRPKAKAAAPAEPTNPS
jgi:hypothetical protein